MPRKLSSIAPDWWDYTTLDDEIIQAVARLTPDAMLKLSNKEAVEVSIDGGSTVLVQAGKPPVVNGEFEERMRVGCGSATIGIFAQQWRDHCDEVIVVDDHITGVLTEHQAGKFLDMKSAGIRVRGRKSTPGRYFQVANPGNGWGGTDIDDPLSIIEGWEEGVARPGLRYGDAAPPAWPGRRR